MFKFSPHPKYALKCAYFVCAQPGENRTNEILFF